MITKHTFMVVRYPTCRRVILWEHHDEGENCEDVKCVGMIVEFNDTHTARNVYDVIRAMTDFHFRDRGEFRKAWKERKEVEA